MTDQRKADAVVKAMDPDAYCAVVDCIEPPELDISLCTECMDAWRRWAWDKEFREFL